MKIGLWGLGDMGAAVGRSLVQAGYDVLAVFEGRSEESRARGEAAGITAVPNLASLVETDVVLSILPPGIALAVSEDFCRCAEASTSKPLYADLNAIAPRTTKEIAAKLEGAGIDFVDGAIIGASPFKGKQRTRIYLSGAHAETCTFLSTPEMSTSVCGPDIGQASGLKMVYAALTKGTMTLHTAVLLAAHRMGLMDPLLQELEGSQADRLGAMRGTVPFIAADSVRWADEMDQIAACFSDAGVTPNFHEGAGDIFRLLAQTPLESETRETMDYSRTLEAAMEIYAESLQGKPIT